MIFVKEINTRGRLFTSFSAKGRADPLPSSVWRLIQREPFRFPRVEKTDLVARTLTQPSSFLPLLVTTRDVSRPGTKCAKLNASPPSLSVFVCARVTRFVWARIGRQRVIILVFLQPCCRQKDRGLAYANGKTRSKSEITCDRFHPTTSVALFANETISIGNFRSRFSTPRGKWKWVNNFGKRTGMR